MFFQYFFESLTYFFEVRIFLIQVKKQNIPFASTDSIASPLCWRHAIVDRRCLGYFKDRGGQTDDRGIGFRSALDAEQPGQIAAAARTSKGSKATRAD